MTAPPPRQLTLFWALIGQAALAGPARGAEGRAVGWMRGTYYYAARQADHADAAPEVALRDRSCAVIARVPRALAADLRMQGSAVLDDGRVVNLRSRCRCGAVARGDTCCTVLDGARFPFGMGARDNALVPLRSLAVDRRRVRPGATLYIAAWDGVRIPRVDGLGGFVHDGCFRADDVGVRGMRLDIFTGTRAMWRALERLVPTRRRVRVLRDAPRCAR